MYKIHCYILLISTWRYTTVSYANLLLLTSFCLTIMDIYRFGEVTEWCDKPTVKVAVTVDAPTVVKLVMERLIES